jgi:hypothetical protein
VNSHPSTVAYIIGEYADSILFINLITFPPAVPLISTLSNLQFIALNILLLSTLI